MMFGYCLKLVLESWKWGMKGSQIKLDCLYVYNFLGGVRDIRDFIIYCFLLLYMFYFFHNKNLLPEKIIIDINYNKIHISLKHTSYM